jgi:hypothetical protein
MLKAALCVCLGMRLVRWLDGCKRVDHVEGGSLQSAGLIDVFVMCLKFRRSCKAGLPASLLTL